MKLRFRACLFPLLFLASFPAAADKFSDAQKMFEGAGVGDMQSHNKLVKS